MNNTSRMYSKVVLVRLSTASRLEYLLPDPMTTHEIEQWRDVYFPEWGIASYHTLPLLAQDCGCDESDDEIRWYD